MEERAARLFAPEAAEGGVFVVAEIGKNFIDTPEEQDVATHLEKAIALVDAAKEAGADAVKFQTHVAEDEQLPLEVVSPHFKGADRYAWVTRNERATPLKEFWKPLKAHCDAIGITFFTTPMSRKAAEKIVELDPPFWKVGSGDVQDFVLLEYLLATGKPIIISTGMISLAELDELVSFFRARTAPCAILYCVSKYPCPPEEFNLATLERVRDTYPEIPVGFSDHSITHEAALAAAKLGACIIEKHFSFSRGLWGSDHKASLTPEEMKAFVGMLREGAHERAEVEALYGDPDRELEGANNEFRPYFNKGLACARDLPAEHVLGLDDVHAMRPIKYFTGVPARDLHAVIGRRLTQPCGYHEPVRFDLLTP